MPTVMRMSWITATDGGHRHLELEPHRDVDGHRDEEHDEGLDGLGCHLTTPGGAHVAERDVVHRDVGRLGQVRLHVLLDGRSVRLRLGVEVGLDLDRLGVVELVGQQHHGRLAHAGVSAAVVAWATVSWVFEMVHDWPPLKSMPRFRPRVPRESSSSQDDDGGDAEPPFPLADEVEGRPASEQAHQGIRAFFPPAASVP